MSFYSDGMKILTYIPWVKYSLRGSLEFPRESKNLKNVCHNKNKNLDIYIILTKLACS